MQQSTFELNGFTVQIDKLDGSYMASIYRQGVYMDGQDGFVSYESAVAWATHEIEGLDIQVLHS